MKPGTRYGIAAAALMLVVIVAVGVSLFLAGRALEASNRHWCVTLDLITSTPVPKPADPQRNKLAEQQWQFYAAMLDLKRQFGC